MKFLTLLFAFYILLLPCILCTDSEECTDDSETQITHSTGQRQHQHENETCNPFCTCACCGQILLSNLQLNKTIIARPVQLLQQHTYNSIILSSDCFGNIWQPPKSNV